MVQDQNLKSFKNEKTFCFSLWVRPASTSCVMQQLFGVCWLLKEYTYVYLGHGSCLHWAAMQNLNLFVAVTVDWCNYWGRINTFCLLQSAVLLPFFLPYYRKRSVQVCQTFGQSLRFSACAPGPQVKNTACNETTSLLLQHSREAGTADWWCGLVRRGGRGWVTFVLTTEHALRWKPIEKKQKWTGLFDTWWCFEWVQNNPEQVSFDGIFSLPQSRNKKL